MGRDSLDVLKGRLREFADILIYLVRIADKLGIDLIEAGHRKVDVNKVKYPSGAVKGDARKYTEYCPGC